MNPMRLILCAAALLLAAAATYAQSFPSAPGNETTQSYGNFKILIESKFAGHFTGCPGYDAATRILTSPILYDPSTVIGVSAATKEGTPAEHGPGIPVGTPPVSISDHSMSPPAGYPAPANGTREVHTQMRMLNMTGGGVTVSLDPGTISPGEVDSHSSSGNPANDFPARSFFDIYVRIVLPHCGTFPGAMVHNRHNEPIKVQNADDLHSLPPGGIVYVHDESSAVPIRFVSNNGKLWHQDEPLGCIVFAGHGLAQQKGEPPEEGKRKFEEKARGHEHAHTAHGCPESQGDHGRK